MRLVFGAVLIAGVGLAGYAVFHTHTYVTQLQSELAEARRNANTAEMVNVFVSGRTLRYGERLSRSDVRVAPFPAYAVPTGAYTDVEALFPNNAEYRTVLRAMEPLEPIMTSKLTAPGAGAGIMSHLSPGMRAFTIPVNVTSGVAGFLRPGDHVDVFWTGRSENSEMTQLIQSQIRLIAVDQSADMDGTTNMSAARSVTVEATPEQAARLAQAQSSGRLSLALVGAGDNAPSTAIEMTQDRLLGIVREERRVEAEPEKCHVRTRRGNDMVLIEIPCTN